MRVINKKCHQFDIGNFIDKGNVLSEAEQLELVEKVFVPDTNFKFPLNNKRRFQPSWFDRFKWLTYSTKYDGAFCLYCVLFRHTTKDFAKVLITEPFRNWNKGIEFLNKHEGSHKVSSKTFLGIHAETSTLYKRLTANVSDKPLEPTVDELLDRNFQSKLSVAKNALIPIIDTVVTCARM